MSTNPVMLYEDRTETGHYFLSTWLEDDGQQVYLVTLSNPRVYVREKNHDFKRAVAILVTARVVVGSYEGENLEALHEALGSIKHVELAG